MKFAFFFLLLFAFQTAYAQLVYLSAEENFSISNCANKHSTNAAWLKFKDEAASAEILLDSGKKLKRFFKAEVANPYYVIENNKVRYRPNMAIAKADTFYIGTTSLDKSSTIEEIVFTEWDSVLTSLKSLEYEYEKTEKAKAICQDLNPNCKDIVAILYCLQYDASRVEVINNLPSQVRNDCRADLQKTISAPYRATLKAE